MWQWIDGLWGLEDSVAKVVIVVGVVYLWVGSMGAWTT